MTVRVVTPADDEEWAPFERAIAAAFGEVPVERTADQIARNLDLKPMEMRIGIADGDEILGGCFSHDFDLSMPGGGSVPVAGLGGVGIDPTKTGRGGLRAMMEEHLRRSKRRGHAASTLLASETVLYGRFGYGRATTLSSYEIASGHSSFAEPIESTGSLELVTHVASVVDTLAEVYVAAAAVRAGATSRSTAWWGVVVGDTATWLGGGKQLAVIHRSSDGAATGYLLYSVKDSSSNWVTNNTLEIKELVAVDLETELALFRFATTVPLTRHVAWTQAPPDTAVEQHLADPRQLRKVDEHDLLWLRPLDVRRLLEARSYSHDDSIAIAVDDDLFPDQRGPWTLEVRGGIGSVEPTSAEPDVVVTPRQLAMVLLGDTRVAALVSAGVLAGESEPLGRFDRLMLTDRRPFNLSKF